MKEKVRLDKWLWSVRFYKSRTIATEACKNGRISINDHILKPSYLLEENQLLHIKKSGFTLLFKVKSLIEKRVSAAIAITCYENLTSPEELNKFNQWYIGKGRAEIREHGSGRPSKKDRREMDDFKGQEFDWDE
ncbi:MAG: RNA-binding S4 domain-containing protein [Bacteroidota bacterium]|nr:RNA-binding S4 domain-containing protein [Bacteroidota bacterium]